jgi:hypothetical protein
VVFGLLLEAAGAGFGGFGAEGLAPALDVRVDHVLAVAGVAMGLAGTFVEGLIQFDGGQLLLPLEVPDLMHRQEDRRPARAGWPGQQTKLLIRNHLGGTFCITLLNGMQK